MRHIHTAIIAIFVAVLTFTMSACSLFTPKEELTPEVIEQRLVLVDAALEEHREEATKIRRIAGVGTAAAGVGTIGLGMYYRTLEDAGGGGSLDTSSQMFVLGGTIIALGGITALVPGWEEIKILLYQHRREGGARDLDILVVGEGLLTEAAYNSLQFKYGYGIGLLAGGVLAVGVGTTSDDVSSGARPYFASLGALAAVVGGIILLTPTGAGDRWSRYQNAIAQPPAPKPEVSLVPLVFDGGGGIGIVVVD